MRLAFWNNGSPKEVDPQRVRFPNGDVSYDVSPDPNRDLYEFVPTADPPCHPWQTKTMTHELIGGKIKETQSCIWPPIAELKTRKKDQITARRRLVASGNILVGGRVIKCNDGNISELEVLVSQTARGKVTYPIKATTSAGVAFKFTSAVEVQALLDAIQAHRQTTRNIDHDHLVSVDALTDPQLVADYDQSIGWPVVLE